MRVSKVRRHDTPPLSGEVVANFLSAEDRVKGKPGTRMNMARWLLDFSFRKRSELTQQDWRNLQWEALAFPYTPPNDAHLLPLTALPSKRELIAMQQWLLDFWAVLGKGKEVEIKTPAPRIFVVIEDRLNGIVSQLKVSWAEAFISRIWEILNAEEVAPRVRFCQQCRHPFCAQKRQAYCSSNCSQSHRTKAWREKNHETFLAARRAGYKRRMQKIHGQFVKVNSRPTTAHSPSGTGHGDKGKDQHHGKKRR